MAKKLFGGKESRKEELAEAKALKSGRISEKQYVAGEKSEGHGAGAAGYAKAIKSGALSPKAYAAEEAGEKMKCGGKVKKMAGGGAVAMPKKEDMGSMNMKCGGKVKKMAIGGIPRPMPAQISGGTGPRVNQPAPAGLTRPAPTGNFGPATNAPTPAGRFPSGPVANMPARMAKGGGVETRGKTKGTEVKMAKGGKINGCATKGKTRGKIC